MPTLRFHDKFKPAERKILSRTFHQNCRDLGIMHRDASIDVRRVTMKNEISLGAITMIEPDRFIMILNAKNDLMKTIFCIGHEMVHFDQYTRGDLSDDRRGTAVLWKGESFPSWMCKSRAHYTSLPWEAEAISKQHKLMDSAMRCLPYDERRQVCDTALREAA